MNNCGVCNQYVPSNHPQLVRKESDGSLTRYHSICIPESNDLKRCPYCGHHRKLCSECKNREEIA